MTKYVLLNLVATMGFFASATSVDPTPTDFVAPIVASEADVPMQAGLMFYDIGEGLKIVNPNGVVEVISTTGVDPVTSGGTSQRVEHARITYSGGTPSVNRQSGTWIASITDGGTGQPTLNITSGVFSSAPNCTCTLEENAGSSGTCTFNGDATTTTVAMRTRAAGSFVDENIHIICMGAN